MSRSGHRSELPQSEVRSGRLILSVTLWVAVAAAAAPADAGTFVHPTEGWSVTYPPGWDTNAAVVASNGSPFRTCSSRCRVQIVPAGQAEITVRTLPASTDEYAEMDKITRDADIIASPAPMSNRRDYRWGGVFRNAIVAARKGGKLFFVQLARRSPDGADPEYDALYRSVLDSLTPATGAR
jgi:hypothetical protein